MAPATVLVLQPLATPEHIGFLTQGTRMLPPSWLAQAALTAEQQCLGGKRGLVLRAPPSLSLPQSLHYPLLSKSIRFPANECEGMPVDVKCDCSVKQWHNDK